MKTFRITFEIGNPHVEEECERDNDHAHQSDIMRTIAALLPDLMGLVKPPAQAATPPDASDPK